MVACGLWRIAKATGHGPRRASGVGAAHVECGKDTRISTLVAGAMRSPHGMDRASNSRVTEARSLTHYATHGWPSS